MKKSHVQERFYSLISIIRQPRNSVLHSYKLEWKSIPTQNYLIWLQGQRLFGNVCISIFSNLSMLTFYKVSSSDLDCCLFLGPSNSNGENCLTLSINGLTNNIIITIHSGFHTDVIFIHDFSMSNLRFSITKFFNVYEEKAGKMDLYTGNNQNIDQHDAKDNHIISFWQGFLLLPLQSSNQHTLTLENAKQVNDDFQFLPILYEFSITFPDKLFQKLFHYLTWQKLFPEFSMTFGNPEYKVALFEYVLNSFK